MCVRCTPIKLIIYKVLLDLAYWIFLGRAHQTYVVVCVYLGNYMTVCVHYKTL